MYNSVLQHHFVVPMVKLARPKQLFHSTGNTVASCHRAQIVVAQVIVHEERRVASLSIALSHGSRRQCAIEPAPFTETLSSGRNSEGLQHKTKQW